MSSRRRGAYPRRRHIATDFDRVISPRTPGARSAAGNRTVTRGAADSGDRGGFFCRFVLLPLVLGRVYDDKDVQEQIIRNSTLDWVIVRPGLLTSGPRTGACRALTDPSAWRMGRISCANVDDFLVRQIVDDTYLGKTPLLIY